MNVFDLVATISLDSSSYDSSLNKAKSAGESITGSIGGAFGKVAKVGAAALAGATTAVVGFAGASVKAGMEFDTAMSGVGATMGFTVDEINDAGTEAGKTFNQLKEFAMKMGAETEFSSTEAAEALNYMALAGYDAETSMKMLPNVLNLASAGSMDLARASDMVTDAQSALGLNTEETTELVDKMAKASSKSNTSVAQLGEAILTVGGTAKDLNGGTTELAASLGVLANAGIKGAEGGTALRNVLLALTPKSDDAAEAMETIGMNAYDADGNLRPLNETFVDMAHAMEGMSTKERQQILSNIFNKVDLKSVNALMAQSVDGFDKLTYSLQGASIDWEKYSSSPWMKAEDAMGDFAEFTLQKLDEQGGSVEKVTQDIIDKYGLSAEEAAEAVNVVNEAVENGGSTWRQLENDIENSTGAAQEMAKVKLENLEGSLKLAQSAFNNLQLLVSAQLTPALRSFVDLGTEGMSQMAKALSEGDISGAMDAFTDILTKGLDKIIDGLPKAVEAGAQLLGAVAEGVIKNLPKLVTAGLQIVTQLMKSLVSAIPTMASTGSELVQGLSSAISEALPELMAVGNELITTLVQSITDAIPNLMALAPEMITGLFDALSTNLTVLTDAGINIIQSITQGITENLPSMIEAGLTGLMDFSANLRENAGKLVDAGLDMIMAIADGLIKSLPVMIKTIPTIISNIAGIINDNAPKLLVAAGQLIIMLAQGLIEAIPTLVAEIPKIIQAIWDVFTAFNWINLGTSIITFIGEGITSLATAIPDALKSIGESALNLFRSINWANLGATVINLIVAGIRGLLSIIPNTLKAIGTAAVALFKAIDWRALGVTVINFLINGIKSVASTLSNTVKDLGQKAHDFFKNIKWADLGKNVITFLINGIKGIGARIGDTLKQLGTKAHDLFHNIKWQALGNNVIKFIVNGVKSIGNTVGTALREIAQKGLEAVKKIDWKGLGTNMIKGIINGVKSMASNLVGALKDVVTKGLNAAKSALGIKSPSRVMRDQVGKNISLGIAEGIEQNTKAIESAMIDATDIVSGTDIKVGSGFGTVGAGEYGGNNVTINVYGAVGQSVEELAEIIEQKIAEATIRRDRAFV